LQILGPNADKLISSGDPVEDKKAQHKFLEAYDTDHKLESEGMNKDVLVIGEEEWPMPIPLVQTDAGWQFDTEAGEQEILNRRIGRNELNVIRTARAYVEAQNDYADMMQQTKGKHEYAQNLISSHNQHDGLYWPAGPTDVESPLGPLIAHAAAQGYWIKTTDGKQTAAPYHGYYFKILKRQGSNAAGGAKSYLAHGHMTEGFALLAFPAKYGVSGVMTFIVNQNGFVYEKNLGPETVKEARRINGFDPDSTWRTAQD